MYKALQIAEPNHSAVIRKENKNLHPDQVRIEVKACGICGTDIHIFRGDYMGNYPIVPGHEFSGVIESLGDNVEKLKVGDGVAVEPNLSCGECSYCKEGKINFCEKWQAVGVTMPGGMAEYVDVPMSAVFNIGDLTFEEAAFMEPLSCCIHGIKKVEINKGESVTVFGAGPIGLLIIQLVKYYGASRIIVLDKNEKRLQFAKGFTECEIIGTLDNLEEESYDVVIDATGAIPLMEQTINYTRKGGRVLLFGVPPKNKTVNFNSFTVFEKGLTILSSFTSVHNSEEALNLIRSKDVRVRELISHKLHLDEFEKGIQLLELGQENVKKVMLIP